MKRQLTNAEIMAVWKGFEEDEPDISTERLIEQTIQATGVSHRRICQALEAELEDQPKARTHACATRERIE